MAHLTIRGFDITLDDAALEGTTLVTSAPAEAPGLRLFPGDLFQVLDNWGTWHAAAVGPGVLCGANRDVAVRTESWDYGTDLVDCPSRACTFVLGRR